MTGAQRLILTLGIVVVAAIAFIVLKGTEQATTDSVSSDITQTQQATRPEAGKRAEAGRRPETGKRSQTGPSRPAAPAIPRIVVRDLQPVGGVRELAVEAGATIRFTVVSDQPEEIHLHGYDVAHDVAPGQPARFAVPAKIEGIFEAELEHTGTQIAAITVSP